jgi:hypothetical protein
VFTENGIPGDGGPFDGSLDLINAAEDALSFESTSFGGHNLYFESGSSSYFGNYLAISSTVPELSTWVLALLGFAGLVLVALFNSSIRLLA